jgi:hypothetical protein
VSVLCQQVRHLLQEAPKHCVPPLPPPPALRMVACVCSKEDIQSQSSL